MNRPACGNTWMRALTLAMALGAAGMLPLASDALAQDTIQTVVTSYRPTVTETIDANGFRHPGVGLTKDVLENMRTQVRAGKEPWATYFNQMLLSSAASRTVVSSNQSSTDPSKPAVVAFNSQAVQSRFIADALRAYTQAILYYVSGDETYRANAMRLVRIWSQMDPAQYAYYKDAHIHSGIPLNRMVTAAEILRYSSTQTPALAWTDADTDAFTRNLITPVIETLQHKNTYFMNQHLYPLIGATSGYIFTGNRERYNEAVEWFTVNRTAVDQGQNGAIKQLFRLVTKNDLTGEPVTPVVQHVEMGRDQAHGAGDLTNASILARLLMAQDTKVDPAEGTPSTAPDAVGPYEFLNDRILDANEYFAHYTLGYDTPWVPTAAHTDANGVPTIIYKQLSSAYRGRLTQNTWDAFYYYKYVRGLNIEERAPSLTKMLAARPLYNWDGVDGGGDFWIYIPAAAEAEGTQYLVKPVVDPIREAEDRFTALDASSTAAQDATASYVRVMTTAAGSKIVLTSYANSSKTLAFRVRTNGIATMEVFGDTIVLPDTKGQWRYVSHALDEFQSLGDFFEMTFKGAGTTVDFDHLNINAGATLTPPVFNAGNQDLSLYTNAGSAAAVSYSFAATDATATDVLSYQIDHLPPGAAFDVRTGAFSWKPTQAGTYTFVVSSSDGTVVTSRQVQVAVSADRQSAIAAAAAAFKPNIPYTSVSLAAYNAAHADVTNALASATDDVFYQKLAALGSAAAALQELSPLRNDGSMDYARMFSSSTFGTSVPNALDDMPDTFVAYTLAVDRSHVFDFGPGYKVAASAFQLQVRASFPERIGGIAMFGSNDMQTWVRLTPGLTTVTEDMQTLDVDADQRNQRFRFLKMQMVQPSSSLLEVAEFRIFGTRHESVNRLSAVSIESPQGLRNRIVAGSTVKLAFQATAPINGVNATIHGLPAQVSTADNLNWTATAVLGADAAPGPVNFNIQYKTAEGVDADPMSFTTDGSSLYVSDQTGYLGQILSIANLQDSNGRTPADLQTVAKSLFDSNLATFTDFRLNGSGAGGYLTFDFKEGGQATLTRAEIVPRQDQYYTRIAGTVLQGSNDKLAWTTISNAAISTADWQLLTVRSLLPYRYIRVYNGSSWFGNMAELRLFGAVASANKIASTSISSPQGLRNRIVPGNTVKLTFTAQEAINDVNVTIQGQPATVTTSDSINHTAVATLSQDAAPGPVKFAIAYKQQNGQDGVTITATTDNTALYVANESDLIRNVPTIATLIDSTAGRTASATLTQVNNLFDANLATNSDFRIGSNNSGAGSYITFDFKSGNQVYLASVELAARQDSFSTRIAGTVVQGSNDNATWTTLTSAATSTLDWQQIPAASAAPYRYIRLYNAGSWFGNMAEVRLHGHVRGSDTTAPVTTATTTPASPAGGTYTGPVTIALSATDTGSGIASTWYSIDGGAPQSGNAVSLTATGPHTIVYWSVDGAGNVEMQRLLAVNIGAANVSSSVKMTQQGATLNRATGKYVGGVTITNTSGGALAGPLWLRLGGLSSGVTLDNASGTDIGAAYVAVPGTLNPGTTINVPLTFSNPSRVLVTYSPSLHKPSF